MKSEERHQLQTNELEKLAGKASVTLDTYSNQILWGVAIVLLSLAGWIYWTSTRENAQAGAWTDYVNSDSPEQFAEVARLHPGTTAAAWARLKEAEGLLNQGIRDLFQNREKAKTDLAKAEAAYQALFQSLPLPLAVEERGLFGLARTLEANATTDLAPAIQKYEELLKKFPNTPYKTEAEQRVKALASGQAQSFYTWFAAQNPKPKAPPKPADEGDTGGIKSPVFDLEKALQGTSPPAGPALLTQPPTEEGTDTPAPDETPAPETDEATPPAAEDSPAAPPSTTEETPEPESTEESAPEESPDSPAPSTSETPAESKPETP